MPKTKSGSSKARPRSRTLTSVSWIEGMLCLVTAFAAFVIVLCQHHEILSSRSQTAVYFVIQVTLHHLVHCLLTHMLCQHNMSCSNLLAEMHLQRCCDCSQYGRQLVDHTGQCYFIAVCLVLLVAQQYKHKHAFLVVCLYASSKDSLFSQVPSCQVLETARFRTVFAQPIGCCAKACTLIFDCNLFSYRSTMPSWMTLCTQQRLSASGYDTRWTDPERSRFASLHYLLRPITNAVFLSGSNSCLMRLEQLSAARTSVILCVASSMHLSWKCCRALGFGMDVCQDRSLHNIAMTYVVMDLFCYIW
jgi:hypothetical protein